MKSPPFVSDVLSDIERTLQGLELPPEYTPKTDLERALFLEEELPGSRVTGNLPFDPKRAPYVHYTTKLGQPFSFNDLHQKAVLEWLDLYNYQKQAKAVTTCGTGYARLECPNGHAKYARTSCRRDYCPRCGQKGSSEHTRRTVRAADRLLWAPVLGYLVFTLPKEIQEKRADKGQLTDLARAIQRIIRRYFPTPGGFLRYHLLGDRPGTFHIHANVLLPITGTAGKGKVEEEVLDLVRKDYTHEVNTIFGLKEEVCNIHYSFAATKKKMYHKIRYVMRPIVTTLEFLMLTDEEKHFVLGLEGWHNTRWFGELANNCYKKFLCASGIDPEAHSKRNIGLSKVCPVCGGRFRFIEMIPRESLPRGQLRYLSDGVFVDLCIYSVMRGIPG
jgi:hypothetical protein